MGEIGWFEPSTAKALSIENSELCDSKAWARFAPIKSKIERACFLMTLGTSQGRATVAPRELDTLSLIVHSLSDPIVLNWVACGLTGMLMDLSGVAVQLCVWWVGWNVASSGYRWIYMVFY